LPSTPGLILSSAQFRPPWTLKKNSPEPWRPCSAAARRSLPPSSLPCFAARLRASGSYVEAFIAAAEPDQVATIVRRERSALRVGEREYHVRHCRSAEIVARAGYTLETIERVVLPGDVALARTLLSELLDAEQQIAERCYEDDFGAEDLARVRSLLSATTAR
jgi:hypothetical protein